ncbi:hypothetical protein ACWC09_03600 [Streptomyces sp. NPDC001617]
MTRFDPRGMANRALLVGVSEYDHRGPPHGVPGHLPAVEHNVRRLREALAGGEIFGEGEIGVLRSPDLSGFPDRGGRPHRDGGGLMALRRPAALAALLLVAACSGGGG